jgi:hypothetical protein
MQCDHCFGDEDETEWRADPFLDEVYCEMVWSWWCDRCWYDRKLEV